VSFALDARRKVAPEPLRGRRLDASACPRGIASPVLTCPNCGHENPDGAKFCMECATALGAGMPAQETRKIITALFCDLVGSTSLGENHDPEILRPILERYFDEMREAAERHGGRVQKFIGDAVVAVFGLPSAHEDDALRAVRAAVEMQGRMATLDEASPFPLAARIGITTGEVLVSGDDRPIIGDAMNTASRLQSGAQPGEVLMGEPTWRLVRGAVVAHAISPIEAKGKAEPVAAWRVQEVRPAPARADTPFVGRSRYVRMLEEALDDAVDADGCVLVTILAPPGVGKSRLAETFAASLGDQATILVGQTPSYGEGVTFAPLVELVSQAVGRPSGDAGEVAAALRARLAAHQDGASVADRLAQFLGVGDASAADTSWAVRRLLEVLSAERPLVVELEDMHWAETPILDLVDAVVDRLHGPVLVLCLARPELLEQRPTWAAGKPRAITMTLPPLSTEDTRRIAEILLGSQTPGSVVERICGTAEGNPLYLEQFAAMLADQGLLVEGRWTGADDVEVEIPTSLQALLAARLDRLDPVTRRVLARASIEGRRFRIASLQALAPEVAPGSLESSIASLDTSGLVQPEDEAGGRWRFAHALVLDAAYRGLSKGQRAELHERFAGWLAVEDAEQADVGESVARHLERALHLREELGLRDERSAALALRAGELFAIAGTRAFATLDFITTRDLLGRAAVLLPEADPRRLDLLPNLAVALTETGRPEETEVLLTKSLEQSRAAGSERDVLRAKVQLLSNVVYRSPTEIEIDRAVAEGEQAADSLQGLDDDIGLAEAAIALDYLEFVRGHLERAGEWSLRALRYGVMAERIREAAQGAADTVAFAVLGPLPFASVAATLGGELLALDGPMAEAAGHAVLATASLAGGDEPGFHERERRWRDVIDRNGLGWLGATHAIPIAIVEHMCGRAASAERRLREAREMLAALGDVWWVETLDGELCAAVGAQDRPQEFLRMVDAFDVSLAIADRSSLVRRSLLRSRALLVRGSAADAEVAVRRGLELVATTDHELLHADALITLADVLDVRGLAVDAAEARAGAIARLRAKGHLTAVARLELSSPPGRGASGRGRPSARAHRRPRT
jgi:class 3 adenylate cyclase